LPRPWSEYGPLFRDYLNPHDPAELLAAMAQGREFGQYGDAHLLALAMVLIRSRSTSPPPAPSGLPSCWMDLCRGRAVLHRENAVRGHGCGRLTHHAAVIPRAMPSSSNPGISIAMWLMCSVAFQHAKPERATEAGLAAFHSISAAGGQPRPSRAASLQMNADEARGDQLGRAYVARVNAMKRQQFQRLAQTAD